MVQKVRDAQSIVGVIGYCRSMGRVLLVDPIADDREYQAHVLRSAGLEVLEPEDNNALKAALTLRPDAIVVDVSPRRPGAEEFVRTLKDDPRTASIPVLVLSSYPRTDLPPTEGFVGKPCTPDRMLAELLRVVNGSGRESRR
jgi:CheY-like chemotaxis protein